jgi:hypothetical protein
MIALFNAFRAQKACTFATYKRPIIKDTGGFPDVYESLEDTTIHTQELDQWSHNLIRSTHQEDPEQLCERICQRWQYLSNLLNAWYARLHQHFDLAFKDNGNAMEKDMSKDFEHHIG